MKEPLVSIIIPVYNAADTLEETILCALAQTWKNKELIIVNDGSTDNSIVIAKKYESECVKVFSQINNGASSARNMGIEKSQGIFIQFLDADDLIDRSKIENQLMVLKDIENAVAYGPFAKFVSSDDLSSSTNSYLSSDYKSGRQFLYDLYGGNTGSNHPGGMIPLHCWLVPRNIIEKSGNWNEELSVDDDGEFFCRVLLQVDAIKYVDAAKSYYRYHSHNNNLSSQVTYKAHTSSFKALRLKNENINDEKFHILFANQAIQLLVNIFPKHPNLCRSIKRFITELGGNAWQPYQENPHKVFRRIFGWRFVKLLSYYKNK